MYKKVILNFLLINLYCITNSSPANIPDISLTIFNKSIELDATSIANLIEDEAGSDDVFEKKVFWLNNDPLSDEDLRILKEMFQPNTDSFDDDSYSDLFDDDTPQITSSLDIPSTDENDFDLIKHFNLPGITEEHYNIINLIKQNPPYSLTTPKISKILSLALTKASKLCHECIAAGLLVSQQSQHGCCYALGNPTSKKLRTLNEEQLKIIQLFRQQDTITAEDIAECLNSKISTAHSRRRVWVAAGFLIGTTSKNTRGPYALSPLYTHLLN